ncbi:MAG: type II toxin-antitoxin system HicB family antitoxin [Candidatus Jacksonbacteria bacterium]
MNNYQFMAKIWREDNWFIAQDIFSGVTTQGKSIEKARNNLKEAVELYAEVSKKDFFNKI